MKSAYEKKIRGNNLNNIVKQSITYRYHLYCL